MMKSILTLLFIIALCGATNAASAKIFDNSEPNTHLTKINNEQNAQEVKKENTAKYNFSLFKFIAPASIQETDSTQQVKETLIDEKDETVYVNPLSFFKFSYAS